MAVYHAPPFRKILVPLFPGKGTNDALGIAHLLSNGGRIVLTGLVGVRQGESLSTAAPQAKEVRDKVRGAAAMPGVNIRERVRVSHDPLDELKMLVEEESPDLLVLNWPRDFESLMVSPQEALNTLSCDIAIVRGPLLECTRSILLPMRGSSYAEKALRVALALSESCDASLTTLHMTPTQLDSPMNASFRGLAKVLNNLPEIEQAIVKADDFLATILEQSNLYDLVIMGMAQPERAETSAFGEITEKVLKNSQAAVIAVRSEKTYHEDFQSELSGYAAISILVDKWFAENTYQADEFADLDYLLALKKKQNVSISLALPALNEEKTVGSVIQTIKSALMDSAPLLDEIVLMDSDSTDRTREIAAGLGIPVHIHQQILPRYGSRPGKGEALWKSLFVTRGDIVLWIDTDIVNIHPRFVYGLIGPLLLREKLLFVKGFYRRPLRMGDRMQASGGGRVTELVARPLLNMFYPELSGIIQPLSGEYGGRRYALERMSFPSGYGVEIGLLIDLFENYGLKTITQVDLQERVHHNQPLDALSKMAYTITQTVMHKLERRYGWHIVEEVNQSMKLIRYEQGRFYLDVEKITAPERPAMIDLPEYIESHPR